MAYLGNEPGVGAFIVATERFNGTGSCTQFTITQTGIQDANVVDVIVNSIQQDPINSYSIANGVITFTEAPSSGTQNIIVRYRATTVITYNNIQNSQIPDGTITASKLAAGVIVPSATANSAAGYANSAFSTANSSFIAANSSGSYANSGFIAANSASIYANSAFLRANTPDAIANSGSAYANSAFNVANGAASVANTDYTTLSFTAGVYGNATIIPSLTISSNGRITAVANTAVSGIDAHPFFFTAMGS